jgi:hypothetical protein
MSHPLEYASSSESRSTRWIVRRYVWWVGACYAGQAAAEFIFQQTEIRQDFPAKLGESVAYTSAVTAAGLFVVGSFYLITQRDARQSARVWIAWLAAGIYPSFMFIVTFISVKEPIILPVLYR